MKAGQINSGLWHQGCQFSNEIQGFENYMGVAITIKGFLFIQITGWQGLQGEYFSTLQKGNNQTL